MYNSDVTLVFKVADLSENYTLLSNTFLLILLNKLYPFGLFSLMVPFEVWRFDIPSENVKINRRLYYWFELI